MNNLSLRNQVKRWNFLWWFVLLGLGTGIVSKRVPHYKEVAIAKVNGKKITRGDFQDALNEARLENELWAMYLGVTPAALERERNPEKTAYQRCVSNVLLDGISEDFGFDFATDYVQEQLVARLPQEVIDPSGAINMEAYKAYTKRLNTSIQEFEKRQEDNLVRELTSFIVGESLYTPRYVAEAEQKELKARKKLGVLHFKFENVLKQVPESDLSGDALEKYFSRHKESYKRPEARSANYWKMDLASYRSKINVEEASLQRYFNAHKSEFSRPAQATVRRILVAVKGTVTEAAAREKAFSLRKELDKAPKEFARVARQSSDDKKSAANGGLMSPFARGAEDTLLERTVFKLKKGEISEVVRTSAGYEIFQLENMAPASEASFESVRKEIHQKVLDKKAMAAMTQDLEATMRAVRDGETTVEQFAESKGLKKHHTGFLSRNDAQGEKLEGLLAQAIFGMLKRRSNSGYFPLEGEFVLYERAETKEAHVPTLDAVKSEVRRDAQKERALERIKVLVDQAKRDFFAGKSLAALADASASYGETAEGAMESLSKGYTACPVIIKKAFRQNEAHQLAEQREKNDYFLATMLKADYSADAGSEKIQPENNYAKTAHVQAFIASLCASAKIVAGQEIAAEQAVETESESPLDY